MRILKLPLQTSSDGNYEIFQFPKNFKKSEKDISKQRKTRKKLLRKKQGKILIAVKYCIIHVLCLYVCLRVYFAIIVIAFNTTCSIFRFATVKGTIACASRKKTSALPVVCIGGRKINNSLFLNSNLLYD